MFARIALTAVCLALTAGPAAATEHSGHCAADRLRVPGAQRQLAACLDDLTTAGTSVTGHTVAADWAGLTSAGLPRPAAVPGVQLDGHFADTSTSNTHHGWNSDAQFVLRMPARWNGGLVISGAPGVRRQYANDRAIADHVLAAGYAFAATDKGNTGTGFHTDGRRPGAAVAEWNTRVTQLTIAAKAVVAQHYGRPPARTLMAGLSNGGYLVRWQLENRPGLYDGGVDWEGTLWTEEGPNMFTSLPAAIRHYPAYAAGDPAAHQAILDAGFAPGSEFLWPFHHQVYWDLTQRIYREEFDPAFDGDLQAGIPFCVSGTPNCDADYDYAARPKSVHRAVERISLTGRIHKPLITLHGTLDALLPISRSSDVYADLVTTQDRSALHRYYRIDGGTHVDGLYDVYPDKLRPLGPCFRTAFDALEGWLDGTPPTGTLVSISASTCGYSRE
ncbi:3HB-oligomer hydrolase (3HBOH) [Actinokineospora alba]|uniref:3HB-oligomer hydrolase (3HBOH) n=1 Tax=Actinokineospora alba TaxID=504798 RepID=A0A1H0PDK5_9PSEU|nr:tannase/feruloyl esterase family alpha/beta hydrolase [Actinokineospora alba]TDP65754.1 3HB-oligomer hydrolase 3HBOH [Actinokineospora alba]SDI65873.1 3HB-oligomer hydrolase (3HBOH) [Actinokineospora alba]SDP03172.1 3HB-oligomer hydrolase (3HBOH) [Actinokineospora alba]